MPAKRRSETAGEPNGPPPAKKKATPEELAVMPNSLEANIGKLGYDSDGVKQIIQQEDKSYHLDEVWRLFGLWMDKNGCQLIRKMMDGRNAPYKRWCPEEFKVTRDEARYNDPDERAYRDDFKEELKQCRKLHLMVLAEELKSWNKLWSLMDETMVNKVEADEFWASVDAARLPNELRTLIMDAADGGIGIGRAEGRENLRAR